MSIFRRVNSMKRHGKVKRIRKSIMRRRLFLNPQSVGNGIIAATVYREADISDMGFSSWTDASLELSDCTRSISLVFETKPPGQAAIRKINKIVNVLLEFRSLLLAEIAYNKEMKKLHPKKKVSKKTVKGGKKT